MLYGRRLEEALDQVGESRYGLVHALSKRSRQITRHLAAEHIDFDSPVESAPTIAGTEGDPLKIAEEEIITGLVIVGEPVDEVIQVAVEETVDPLLVDDEVIVEDEAVEVVAEASEEADDDVVDAAPIVTAEESDDADLGAIVAQAEGSADEE